MRSGFYISDDGEWMIIRLSAFYQSLRDHQFPVRFLGRLNNSYGYPVSNFLYPGFLYIGSLLHFVGFTFVDSVKFILGGSVVGTAVVLFYGYVGNFHGFQAAWASWYLCAHRIFCLIYTKEVLWVRYCIFPAALGLYSIESGKKWLFPISIAFLVVSHNTLALLFLLVLCIVMFLRKRFEYLWLFLLGIVITTFFWMPAFMEKN